jgi:hypothetical protein
MSFAHSAAQWAGRTALSHGADNARQERIARTLHLVEQFVYDLGLLIAGLEPDLTYVAPRCASLLRDTVRPALDSEVIVRPDFGQYAQVAIIGELLNPVAMVRTVVEFEDASTRVDGKGRTVSRARRRIRLRLLLDQELTTVVEHEIEFA